MKKSIFAGIIVSAGKPAGGDLVSGFLSFLPGWILIQRGKYYLNVKLHIYESG
jgi:hypothetical protein